MVRGRRREKMDRREEEEERWREAEDGMLVVTTISGNNTKITAYQQTGEYSVNLILLNKPCVNRGSTAGWGSNHPAVDRLSYRLFTGTILCSMGVYSSTEMVSTARGL